MFIPKPGDFSFVKDDLYREVLTWDYKVVNENNLWSYFRKNKDSFTIQNLNYDWHNYHSGSSWCISMRNMEYIAKHGWERYIQDKHE